MTHGEKAKVKEESAGALLQERIREAVGTLPDTLVKKRGDFQAAVIGALKPVDIRPTTALLKAILSALSERVAHHWSYTAGRQARRQHVLGRIYRGLQAMPAWRSRHQHYVGVDGRSWNRQTGRHRKSLI
jgi:hypothetical protein